MDLKALSAEKLRTRRRAENDRGGNEKAGRLWKIAVRLFCEEKLFHAIQRNLLKFFSIPISHLHLLN